MRDSHPLSEARSLKVCPECGFDMDGRATCRVCGFDARRAPPQSRKGSTTHMIPIVCASAIILLIAALFVAAELPSVIRKPRESSPQPAAVESRKSSTPQDQAASPPRDTTPPVRPIAEPPKTASKAGTEKTGSIAPAVKEPASASSEAPAVEKPVIESRASPAVEKPPIASLVSPSVEEQSLLSVPSENSFDVTKRVELPPLTSRDDFVAWMLAHTDQKEKYLRARWDRAQTILRLEQIKNERVLEAFLMTPREYFCRDTRRAYESAALPIGYGQTISGPHMVSRMTDYLNPQPEHKILEIGTGSGYQSALLSELSNRVYTIEIVKALAEETDKIYQRYEDRLPEYRNIRRKVDDGYYGWEEYAPFDRIIVTCGIDHIPPELLRQLAPDGIMVIPVGPPSGQTILRIVKKISADGSMTLDREDIFHGRRKEIFVPFTAREGGVHTEK